MSFGETFKPMGQTIAFYSQNGINSLSLQSTGEIQIKKGGDKIWRSWCFTAVNESDIPIKMYEPTLTVSE